MLKPKSSGYKASFKKLWSSGEIRSSFRWFSYNSPRDFGLIRDWNCIIVAFLSGLVSFHAALCQMDQTFIINHQNDQNREGKSVFYHWHIVYRCQQNASCSWIPMPPLRHWIITYVFLWVATSVWHMSMQSYFSFQFAYISPWAILFHSLVCRLNVISKGVLFVSSPFTHDALSFVPLPVLGVQLEPQLNMDWNYAPDFEWAFTTAQTKLGPTKKRVAKHTVFLRELSQVYCNVFKLSVTFFKTEV